MQTVVITGGTSGNWSAQNLMNDGKSSRRNGLRNTMCEND